MAGPRIEISYCTQCRWLLRAGWVAQELLSTFSEELGEVALVPGRGGVFDVRLDGELLFSRAEQQRFPEAAELKQLVRDRIIPRATSATSIASRKKISESCDYSPARASLARATKLLPR